MTATIRGMVRLSVFYPAHDGARFDHAYYRDQHVPMVVRAWQPLRTEIDEGLDGPNVAAVHFVFASMETMTAALDAPATAAVRADRDNYTDIVPVRQSSRIVE